MPPRHTKRTAAAPPSHDLRGTFAAELDRAAITTGDRRYRHAASILRAPPAGRPPCADDAAVIEVQWLFDTGRAGKIGVAVGGSLGGHGRPLRHVGAHVQDTAPGRWIATHPASPTRFNAGLLET